MKVAIINNLYKPYNRGGAEMVAEALVHGLDDLGHKIIIITTKPYFAKNKKGIETKNISIIYLSSLYYNIRSIPFFLKIFWHLFDTFDIITAQKIKKIIEREKIDLVITNNLKGISYCLPKFLVKQKIKCIHILHDVQLFYPSGVISQGKENEIDIWPVNIYRKICVWLFADMPVIISPSRWLLDEHTSRDFFANAKKYIFPNPIFHAGSNSNLLTKIEKDETKINFLYVGQVTAGKGIFFLIETIYRISEELKEKIKLTVIGDGADLAKARAMSADKNFIIFTGRLGHEDINNFYYNYDCLIVPSLIYENSPLVIVEAANANMPIIAADIGGIKEQIDHLGGLLFKPGNQADLINKILFFIKNSTLIKKNTQNKKFDVSKFSYIAYTKKIINIAN